MRLFDRDNWLCRRVCTRARTPGDEWHGFEGPAVEKAHDLVRKRYRFVEALFRFQIL